MSISLLCISSRGFLSSNRVTLQCPLLDVVITTDATLYHCALYIKGSRVHIFCWGTWISSMFKAHNVFQELQAVAPMLCKMAFCLSNKVVVLHFDNSTAQDYLCHQGGMASIFISRLACCILNLTNKHDMTLIPLCIPTHLHVEAHYLSQGQLVPKWHLLPHMAQAAFHFWGQPQVDLLASSYTKINVSSITPWKVLHLWRPWG